MAGIHCVCSVRCIYSNCSFTHRFKCNAMMMVLVTSIPCAIKLQWCSHNIVNRSTVAARQHIICTTTRDGGGRSMMRRRESLVTEWCRYLRCCDCRTRALRFELNLSFHLSKMDVFCLLHAACQHTMKMDCDASVRCRCGIPYLATMMTTSTTVRQRLS